MSDIAFILLLVLTGFFSYQIGALRYWRLAELYRRIAEDSIKTSQELIDYAQEQRARLDGIGKISDDILRKIK
jgi:hypothetical protein